MDAFLTSFLSVLLAEMGGRGQILVAALALRYHKDNAVILGLALAALCNCALSAFGGSIIDQWISEAPLNLFSGIAYIFAGFGMLIWQRPVDLLANWKTGALMTSFLGLFILQFGDKSQFIIAANAAHHTAWGLVAVGGWFGIIAACVPAVLLGEQLAKWHPIRAIRFIGGFLLVQWGLHYVLRAFDLIG